MWLNYHSREWCRRPYLSLTAKLSSSSADVQSATAFRQSTVNQGKAGHAQ
jgi:hypothetical protein